MNKFTIALLFSGASAINKYTTATFRPLPESTGAAPWHNYGPNEMKLPYPHDYPVPNLGLDHDIVVTHNNIKLEEGLLKQKLNMGPADQIWNKNGQIKPLVYDTKDPISHPLYNRDYTTA